MTGGSDPWYMKRVVDYILANNAHLGGGRRPVLSHRGHQPSSAALLVVHGRRRHGYSSPSSEHARRRRFCGRHARPASPSTVRSPCSPSPAIAKDHFRQRCRRSGCVAHRFHARARLPTPRGRSPTTTPFVMLFISLGFMYWLRAVKLLPDRPGTTKATTPHPLSFVRGLPRRRRTTDRRPSPTLLLAGVAFGIVALGWKGFVVGPSILFLAYALAGRIEHVPTPGLHGPQRHVPRDADHHRS